MGQPLDHHVYLDLDSFPASFGTPDEIEASVIAGMDAWNGHANLELVYGGDPDFAVFEPEIIISHVADGGGPLESNRQTYGILGASHCDIEIYGADGFFVYDYVFADGVFGIQLSTNVSHEIGHCLGLGHSDWGALMFEAQTESANQLLPTADDVAGLRSLYDSAYWGACTEDSDGDGWMNCEGDCDDADAWRAPGFVEICDGIDNDCDQGVDEDGTVALRFGLDVTSYHQWSAVTFNAYTVDEQTTLEFFEASANVVDDGLVSWMVFEVDAAGDAVLLASPAENRLARDGVWTSPILNIEMHPEFTYFVGFGTDSEAYFKRNIYTADDSGLVQAHGFDHIDWASNRETPGLAARTEYVYDQTLHVTPVDDVNGDGVADLCSAPCLDTADDDGDGTRNCDDACPNEADSDGLCVDNCPTIDNLDQADADGDGVGDACDATPNGPTQPETSNGSSGSSGGGGCSAFELAPAGGFVLFTGLGLFSNRRRLM